MWKVFEQDIPVNADPDGGQHPRNGIVSFITASSYLRGPGFVGMRQHMRAIFDELWIIDLGGDNKGRRKTENVFSIETPVAIATGVRYGQPQPGTAATVHYVSLADLSAKDKKEFLNSLTGIEDERLSWRTCLSGWHDPFLPIDNAEYLAWPALTDLFPWQASGVQLKRSWPVGETKEVLEDRWTELVSPLTAGDLSDDKHTNLQRIATRRGNQLKETGDRKVTSTYGDLFSDERLAPISTLKADSPRPQIRPFAYRSFDQQWVIADTRVGDRMRPPLWAAHGEDQIYLTSLLTEVLGTGPSAVASADVPDLHAFRGSFGGRHIIPLWKDSAATIPNITLGLSAAIGTELGFDPTAQDLLAYCYALLASPDFVSTFWEELTIPGARIPITAEPELFASVRDFGKALIHLHTFGQRFPTAELFATVSSARYSTSISADAYPEKVSYNPSTRTITVGDGAFTNVAPEVWNFEVSGLRVVDSWLGYRLKKRAGKSSGSPLDAIRPSTWPDLDGSKLLGLLDMLETSISLQPTAAALLSDVLASKLIDPSRLPEPTAAEKLPLVGENDDEELDDIDEDGSDLASTAEEGSESY
jgi:predicted helicase